MIQTNHTVLITGGATGIGFALAQKFHSAGHKLILVGRTESALVKATNELRGAKFFCADISMPGCRDQLVAKFPDVTVLVNNAGIQVNATVQASSPETLTQELNVNFLAPVLLTHAYLPLLLKQPAAAIVNVSSGLALVPKQAASMYCASKAALHSFSKTLRWQLEGTPVRVFEVLPSLVDTAMTQGRGSGKISGTQLAEEFWQGFNSDRYEMLIGKTKLLALLKRIAPSIAENIMRKGL